MSGYICDTNVLSALLASTHPRHGDVRAAIGALDARATKFISAITVAELEFGVHLAEIDTGAASPDLRRQLAKAHEYAVLEITRHTGRCIRRIESKPRRQIFKEGAEEGPAPALGGRLDRQGDRKNAPGRRERLVDLRAGEGAQPDRWLPPTAACDALLMRTARFTFVSSESRRTPPSRAVPAPSTATSVARSVRPRWAGGGRRGGPHAALDGSRGLRNSSRPARPPRVEGRRSSLGPSTSRPSGDGAGRRARRRGSGGSRERKPRPPTNARHLRGLARP